MFLVVKKETAVVVAKSEEVNINNIGAILLIGSGEQTYFFYKNVYLILISG